MGGKMMEKLHYLGNDEYFFEFELANNKIDDDDEQFDIAALVSMKELFLGRTGFVVVGEKTYKPKIFETYIKNEENAVILCAIASLYIHNESEARSLNEYLRTHEEFSLSCSVGMKCCSICCTNTLKEHCTHEKGKLYRIGGEKKKCSYILSDVTDAYEWACVKECDNE